MADENEARIYGMADQANRDPPAAQGSRGERASAGLDLSRPVALEDGRTVTVSEASGVAHTEATGRAGITPRHEAEQVSSGRARSKATARRVRDDGWFTPHGEQQ